MIANSAQQRHTTIVVIWHFTLSALNIFFKIKLVLIYIILRKFLTPFPNLNFKKMTLSIMSTAWIHRASLMAGWAIHRMPYTISTSLVWSLYFFFHSVKFSARLIIFSLRYVFSLINETRAADIVNKTSGVLHPSFSWSPVDVVAIYRKILRNGKPSACLSTCQQSLFKANDHRLITDYIVCP